MKSLLEHDYQSPLVIYFSYHIDIPNKLPHNPF